MSLNPEARKPPTIDEVQTLIRALPDTVDALRMLIVAASQRAESLSQGCGLTEEIFHVSELLTDAFAASDDVYAKEAA